MLATRSAGGLVLGMRDQFRLPSFVEQDLTERKLSVVTLLRQAGLPDDFFRQEEIYATTAEFFALWKAIGQLSPDPAIGLDCFR